MFRPVTALAATLPLMLGACSTYYPPLYSAPAVAANAKPGTLKSDCETEGDELKQTVACAEILQSIYSSGYAESAKLQDYSQLPIIGAAATAAWILLKDKDNAAKKVGKIGIGALTYSETRDQLFPKAMSEIYIKGHTGLGCIISEKTYFRGPAADASFAALDKSLKAVTPLAAATMALRYTEPSDGKLPELLKAARTLADQSIDGANKQLRESRKERAAREFAASPFRKSVGEVAAWVASKGRVRTNATYDDLLKRMSSSPATEPAATESVRGKPPPNLSPLELAIWRYNEAAANPPPAAELIPMIGEASQLLVSQTIELQGNTPEYGARLLKVEKCATDLNAG